MNETTTSSSATDKLGSAKDAAGTTAGVAKDQAAEVKDTAVQAGSQVAATAKEQGQQVVSEAAAHARDLLGEARTQATSQLSAQKSSAVTSARSLSDELRALANGEPGQSGIATELVRQASTRLQEVVDWVESREPADLLDEVKDFARRKPGTFLLGAAVLGVLAGRTTRGAVAAAHDDSTPGRHAAVTDAYATPVAIETPELAGTYPASTYATGTYTDDTYSAGTGYPTTGATDAGIGTETVDVRPETTGIGYGARP